MIKHISSLSFLFSFLFIFFYPSHFVEAQNSTSGDTTLFHIGLILNLNSPIGKVTNTCISMALHNFYRVHHNYHPKIRLHVRDSKGDVITATSAALDLIKNVGVEAIIGPETSEEAEFITYLGNQNKIPILSFSAISSSLSSTQFPYFVRVAQNDSLQFNAIAAIVQAYRWKELSIIYDDSQSGFAAVPSLTDTLRDIGTVVHHKTILPNIANETVIMNKLRELKNMSSKVFIVHLSSSLATGFFLGAQKEGMMETGYVWILTCRLTDILGYMDPSVLRSMNGVIGVKTHVPPSKALREFKLQWRKEFEQGHLQTQMSQPNVHALWAYDTIFLMAMAANRVNMKKESPPPPLNDKTTRNVTDLFDINVSPMGSKFLQSILSTNFTGLSGKIQLVDGQLKYSAFRIVNVIRRRDEIIGYWTPRVGFSQSLGAKDLNKHYSEDPKDLKVVTWPGGSQIIPKPITLKIGVPAKTGFDMFMRVSVDPNTHLLNVTGLSAEIFEAVMHGFPYKYDYESFQIADGVATSDYNDLTYRVYQKPYSLSGVSMIVTRKEKNFTKTVWWFLKPLTMGLWFVTIAFFVLKGILVWLFEHGRNPEFQGSPSQQLGKVLSFSFSTLVFAHREKLESNYSRFIVNLWTFAVFILVSCFAANLTSMLTINRLQPKVMTSGPVGYQSGSFVRGLLVDLGYAERNLKPLSTVDEYADALRRGHVSAIADELPYIKVFLAKYCREFTVVGPTYPTGGLGFVFQKGSPLLSDVSKSVLEFTGGERMHNGQKIQDIERKWFGTEICSNDLQFNNTTANQLHFYSFRSIFIIMGVASVGAVFLFFVSFVRKRAKDGSLYEILNKKSIRDRIVAVRRYFRFNKGGRQPSFDLRDAEQQHHGRAAEEMHQIHVALTDNCSLERQGTNAEEGTHNLIRADSLVVEMTPNHNNSEITVVEEATPTPRRE